MNAWFLPSSVILRRSRIQLRNCLNCIVVYFTHWQMSLLQYDGWRWDDIMTSDAPPECSNDVTTEQKKATDDASWVKHERKRHKTYRAKKNAHWTMCFSEHVSQPRMLWRMLWRMISFILGSSDTWRNEISSSAQMLLRFFTEKVEAVRHATDGYPVESYLDPSAVTIFRVPAMNTFRCLKVIQSVASKFFSLDPIPTTILKKIIPGLLLFVTLMCNASLQEGILLLSQRHAIVTPRLKKLG